MSGITAISGSSFDYNQWLLQIAAQQANDQSNTVPAAGSELLAIASASNAGTTATDAGNFSGLQEAIRSAVSSALQDAEKSGNTTDLKTAIQDAVDQVLKDNGIDPDKLKEQLAAGQAAHKGHHHRHHKQAGGAEQSSAATSTDATAANATDDAGSASSSSQQTGQQVDPQIADLLTQLLALASPNGNQSVSGFLLDVKQ